ncbi:MAG: ABC transporter ATP-binding protein [Clostridium sp.]
MESLFKVNGLYLSNNNVQILRDINLEVKKGEILGIIGESGSGKSTLIRALIGMINKSEHIDNGRIMFNNNNILKLSEKEMRKIRGKEIGVVFQNPSSTINPVIKIGKQFIETVNVHEKTDKKECIEKAEELLKKLSLNDVRCILDSYTFELSGGMNQRMAIALAMIMNPKLLICDEPTSALDVTVQAQVVKELMSLRDEYETSMIIVTHSMGVISKMADTVAVMYAGEIIEYGDKDEIINNPVHPYTRALINAVPKMNGPLPEAIKGSMHSFEKNISGCRFAERCRYCEDECIKQEYELTEISDNHFIRCRLSR